MRLTVLRQHTASIPLQSAEESGGYHSSDNHPYFSQDPSQAPVECTMASLCTETFTGSGTAV